MGINWRLTFHLYTYTVGTSDCDCGTHETFIFTAVTWFWTARQVFPWIADNVQFKGVQISLLCALLAWLSALRAAIWCEANGSSNFFAFVDVMCSIWSLWTARDDRPRGWTFSLRIVIWLSCARSHCPVRLRVFMCVSVYVCVCVRVFGGLCGWLWWWIVLLLGVYCISYDVVYRYCTVAQWCSCHALSFESPAFGHSNWSTEKVRLWQVQRRASGGSITLIFAS